MKVRFLFVIFVGALMLPLSPLCFAAYGQNAEVIDGIAAVVNGDVITYSQVRAVVVPREKVLRGQYTGEELVKKLKETRELALKDLIDRQLIIQAFKKENFQIPDHYVDQRLGDIIKENFGNDRNTFIKTLEAQNYAGGKLKAVEPARMIGRARRKKNGNRALAGGPA